MPKDTGQAPKPEPKPEQGKVNGRKFVKYQDLSKEDLVRMLMRVNKRLTRVNRELQEIIGILYYGNTQGSRNSYNRKNYGRGNRQYKKRSEDEDVNYE
jgi:hypothetical protein